MNRVFKDILVGGLTLSAVVNIGSAISSVRCDALIMIDNMVLSPQIRSFIAISKKKISTNGCFISNVDLEGM